jgi:hypothetical protein
MPRYNPRDGTQGTSHRECQHCGKEGHEHDRRRVSRDNGFGYEYWCPGTNPDASEVSA